MCQENDIYIGPKAIVTLTNIGVAEVTIIGKGYFSNKITWSPVSGAKEYVVWRSTSKNGVYDGVKTLTSTSYVDSGLTANKTYYYKVRAYRIVGGKKVYSSYSSVKSVKVR